MRILNDHLHINLEAVATGGGLHIMITVHTMAAVGLLIVVAIRMTFIFILATMIRIGHVYLGLIMSGMA